MVDLLPLQATPLVVIAVIIQVRLAPLQVAKMLQVVSLPLALVPLALILQIQQANHHLNLQANQRASRVQNHHPVNPLAKNLLLARFLWVR